MADIPPLGSEAIKLARSGNLEGAIATATDAVKMHPGDFGLRVFLAMLHVRRTELREALPHLRAAIAIDRTDPFPQRELVRVLIGLGKLEEAGETLAKAQLLGREHTRLRALLHLRRGEITEASELFRQLVDADPVDFESWTNLGLCLLAMDEPQRAVDAFSQSLAVGPDRLSTRLKWIEAHYVSGSGEAALGELRELVRRAPSQANLWVSIAHLENLLGRPEQSLAALERAVAVEGTNPEALVALAETLERRNDLERVERLVGQLASSNARHEKLPLLQARLAYRRGEYEQSLLLARSAPPSSDVGTRAQLIGQSLDRMGDAAGAFAAFTQMNSEDARTGGATERKAERSRATLRDQRGLLTPEWVSSWRDIAPSELREPAFIVGFPRSGTTLLDTLLMGHPEAAVAEEEPMLADVGKAIGDPAQIADLDTDQLAKLRALYFEVAGRHLPDDRGRLLIDKNPLAMGALPIIHRLFPGAPIIFMERHPCDVVLSCFMTRFQPTDFGTNFLTLRDSALFYDEMMHLWTRAVEILPVRLHRTRYERLVDDLEAELRPVAQFLELDWRPELLDHQGTAKKRAFIKTPSYAQVSEPVSSRAAGRWLRYRAQLEPVLPILEPWAGSMGYEV